MRDTRKSFFCRPSRRWVHKVKINVQKLESEGVGCIILVHSKDQPQDTLNGNKPLGSIKEQIFLARLSTVSCSI